MAEPENTQQRPPDGGPAFPTPISFYPPMDITVASDEPGMALRDYFAAKAMVGILSNPVLENLRSDKNEWGDRLIFNEHKIAQNSYAMADAMIKARSL